jgi:hypothetical protein
VGLVHVREGLHGVSKVTVEGKTKLLRCSKTYIRYVNERSDKQLRAGKVELIDSKLSTKNRQQFGSAAVNENNMYVVRN